MPIKKIIVFATFFTLFANAAFAKPVAVAESDTLLHNIQVRIYEDFLASFQDNGIARLEATESKIRALPVRNWITAYWIAYAKYYESVHFIKFKNRKQCQKAIDSAIGLLEEIKNKNSETHALLAFIQSFSIQLSGGMSAAGIAAKVKRNAETAIRLDSANIRAWYVLASNDYYTPVAFGGGKNCEKYLLKAISLEERTIPNPYLPSWGKSEAYSLLIAYYINKENHAEARKYIDIALSLYPDNHTINQYAEMLENKK
jgi:tetratricopeptide (TPR) repeat protein